MKAIEGAVLEIVNLGYEREYWNRQDTAKEVE